MATQVIIDRQYAGKKDPEFMLITARTVVTPCNSVSPEVDASYAEISARLAKHRPSVGPTSFRNKFLIWRPNLLTRLDAVIENA
jgi:hypothetical protein